MQNESDAPVLPDNPIRSDKFWGSVLIALGVISIAFQPFEKIDKAVNESTETALTVGVIILAIVLILIALYGGPALKALTIVWVLTP